MESVLWARAWHVDVRMWYRIGMIERFQIGGPD